jgi:putative intracellular protease/amidase
MTQEIRGQRVGILAADVSADDYDALLMPGGTVNPDQPGADRAGGEERAAELRS